MRALFTVLNFGAIFLLSGLVLEVIPASEGWLHLHVFQSHYKAAKIKGCTINYTWDKP